MKPLKDVLPNTSDKVLYVFYDFETTQYTKYFDKATLHVPDLVCVQQFCSQCEDAKDCGECMRFGQRKHSFWDVPVGDMLSYLCKPRPWANKVVAIAHNAKAFDLHFILNRAVMFKWKPELIMSGLKIMCMKMEHLVFLDSVSFLPCALRKLPKAFGLSASKSWYPHNFNTRENLNYVDPIPDMAYYGVDEMRDDERKEFVVWYDSQRSKSFDNRHVLESYFQDDVTVLRQTCRVFRREFMQIGHIDVFVESITIASAYNKVLRKRFLKPDTVGLIPTGGYTCNNRYSKKALMWLLHMEETDGVLIKHCRNGQEYRLPELPRFSVDGYSPDTNTVYEFLGCFWHGHTCQPFRDVATLSGDIMLERYERTMSRLEQITRAGYQVKVHWECEFEEKP